MARQVDGKLVEKRAGVHVIRNSIVIIATITINHHQHQQPSASITMRCWSLHVQHAHLHSFRTFLTAVKEFGTKNIKLMKISEC